MAPENPRSLWIPTMKNSSYYPTTKDHPQTTFTTAKFPFAWPPSIPVIISHRLRRKIRSRLRANRSPASSLASLQTSFSPADTLRSLRAHRWSFYDGQYILLLILGIFSLCIIETPGPIIKTLVATALITSLLLPITRQFFLPFLPIASWLILFYACR
jgi:inositol phosphorylceramide synthase catalytic subunit